MNKLTIHEGCRRKARHIAMVPTLFFKNNLRGPSSPHPFPHGVAFVSNGVAWFSGVHYGGSILPAPLPNPDLPSFKEWIKTCFGDPDPIETDYKPGTAYKRIALPFASTGTLHEIINWDVVNQSFVALKLLLSKMEAIFETIEPSSHNLDAHGHRVRELLLIACMEVEASWASVLRANGYINDRMTTKDYVKLLNPMILDSYRVGLTSYHDFTAFAPFEGWQSDNSTQSLPWYDAYNKTKHNREDHLSAATLRNAVYAVGAAVVMFYAQFGMNFGTVDARLPVIRNTFRLYFDGEKHPTSCYIPNVNPRVGATDASWDWEMLDYPFPA
jgi:hypothetical protein